MSDKKSPREQVPQRELDSILSVLKEDPLLFERVKEVVEMSQLKDGQSTRIDAVEDELIQRINKLGQQTLSSFGQAVDQQQSQQLRAGGEKVQQREKKL